jgi:hypothetical protein
MDKNSLHCIVFDSTASMHLTKDWQQALGDASNGGGVALCLRT